MKSVFAIFLMFCLQVAISPLCLCLGADFDAEKSAPACCHAPAEEEPAPCPHCDQEMPMAATSPVKGDFSPDPPEWHGFDLVLLEESSSPLAHFVSNFPENRSSWDFEPPPLPLRQVFGVFLI
ncbi:MAG: hypothetical protein P1U85_09825 [Verrucomicrobiales bacterium]|jgi:hypothetical protein|nr:hypothetical protein [Verrucomicrobiales bacterium]